MHKRLKKVFCSLKEHTTVSCAKIATVGGLCDIDLIVVKATAPDDLPLPEAFIHELLKIFSISPPSLHSFALSFTRRFDKTHSWKVALKCLLLLHRLLRSLPEHSPFRAELLSTRSNGLLSLHPCHFRDDSSSRPEDYNVFIRSYAQLLDEALDIVSLDIKASEDDEEEEEEEEQEQEEQKMPRSIQEKMKQVGRKLVLLPQLQSLLDRVMECKPGGTAGKSLIVQSAMKQIIRDSFICYTSFRREIVMVLDNLVQMPYRSCISAFGIYKKAALQANQLCEFYVWCKEKGFCGSYEYPFVDKIPEIQIRALETFLNGMWQLTESSSSPATSPSSWVESCRSTSTEEDEQEKQIVIGRSNLITTHKLAQQEKLNHDQNGFEIRNNEEVAPLIQFEEDENDNWEALLEASANSYSCSDGRNSLNMNDHDHVLRYQQVNFWKNAHDDQEEENPWQMQLYNPNPFCQADYLPMTTSLQGFLWK
ncbi:hypothetical protein Tsubulata_047390 [Turnera subulata]|uniref:ENTH domain-containing protein n=1 Tax=Turnera subulata TaxID=218843 RepID=A0A9Q0J4X4_9ROSI|nr:hypothetical protein Tsubulata_047390 [Turnera subulata]